MRLFKIIGPAYVDGIMGGELVWSLDPELSALVPSFVKGVDMYGKENGIYTRDGSSFRDFMLA
jgi:hypothetical protein